VGLAASMIVLGALGIVGILAWYARDLPSVESLKVYAPPTVTVVTDAQGQVLGEFFEEQRYVTPLEDIPEHVQNAFVAAEDASFWEHGGLDYIGIARAMVKNVREARMAQGASTITQQVARSFLLTREKKLERKIKEVLLAWRIEKSLSKETILYLYLNQIFLGHGAYGVEAASRLYFGKPASSLTVPEAAIIAGLPQAPSTYSPNRNFAAAKARQRYVLDQMALRSMITRAEADQFYDTPLPFVRKRDRNLDLAPYYVEHVRRYLVKEYGHDKVYREGLRVRVPIDLEIQRAANQAVQDGVRRVDRRMGYQGPRGHVKDAAERRARLDAIDTKRTEALAPYDPAWHPGKAPVEPSRLPPLAVAEESEAIVDEVHPKWAKLSVGQRQAILMVDDFAWCHKVNPAQDFRYFQCKSFDDVLHPGDVVLVKVKAVEEDFVAQMGSQAGPTRFPRLQMSQDPAPESAILTVRLRDGAILAMVGGTDYEGTEFNRATQARRQVGSTFKPFVYAAGIDRKENPFTPSSILVDAPIVEEMMPKVGKTEPELWKLDNADGEYLGETTLRRGLILSRNALTVRLAMGLGTRYLHDFFGRFGLETELEQNLSTALGTASLTMTELARAYSVFATLGDRRDLYSISEVVDRDGKVLEKTDEAPLTADVLSEETAFVMVGLLQDVVRAGTAGAALSLGVPVAGKTGTTSEFRDAWFVGFTPEVLTATWVGLDKFESMGKGMYGGDMALPIWIDVMREAVAKYPPSEYPKPPGVVFARVDSKSGLLAKEEEKGVAIAFKRGTEPTTYAPAAGDVDTADFLSGEY
jgi:penicillin-binding protein 1A